MPKQALSTLCVLVLTTSLIACAAGSAASGVDGTWDFTMSSPFGAVNATVTMMADGNNLSGSFDMGNGRIWPIEDGVVDGNAVSFRIDRDGSPMVYDMSATIEGDTANGTAEAMGTQVPWSMTRSN